MSFPSTLEYRATRSALHLPSPRSGQSRPGSTREWGQGNDLNRRNSKNPFFPDPIPDSWSALDLDPEEIGRLVRRHRCGGLADVERIQRTRVVSESPNEMTARINPQNPIRKENRTASSRWWL